MADSAPVAIPVEVTEAGEKVKSLKAAKAPKEEIDAAVANLLELKKKHGLVEEKKEKKKEKEAAPGEEKKLSAKEVINCIIYPYIV